VNVIPANASAVVANATVTDTTAASYLSIFPDKTTRPTASDLNWSPGETVPNLVVAKLGLDGAWSLYNSQGTTNAISDVEGWYAP
jgi:hypothetical protein